MNQLYFNLKKWIMSLFQEWPSWLSYVNSSSSVVLYFSSLLMSSIAQFCSVTQSCLTVCDPMDCSTPGFPVHHQLQSLLKLMSMELVVAFSQLFLCCSLLLLPSIFPSIRVFSKESQFFALGGQSIGASTSAVNIQDWFPLGLTGLILKSKGLSRVFSNTTVQKHQLFGTQLSL